MNGRRINIPGRVYGISRRTTNRFYLFTPDAHRVVEGIFWYCLGVAAKRHGIVVHAAVLMSNHIHLVITDVHGVKSLFFHAFHLNFAQMMKAKLGWPEEVFNKSGTDAWQLLTCDAIIEACGYVIANPTEALAVRRSCDWPGASTRASDMGTRTIRAKRPSFYLDSNNKDWPEGVEIPIAMPRIVELIHGQKGGRDRIAANVAAREKRALGKAKAQGRSFVGVKRILRTPHTHRARSDEEFGKRNPRHAAAGDRGAAHAAIAERWRFNQDYDEALARWTSGDRDVLFPYGTWWMRVHHGVRCHPPPKS